MFEPLTHYNNKPSRTNQISTSVFKRLLFSLWMIINGAGYSLAQTPPHIRFQQLNEQHGLSNNHVSAIIKDATGFMWFGTNTGLNRYDGQQVKVFRHDNADVGSIQSNNIVDLLLGPQDALWVKTLQGINIYHPATETFIRNVDSILHTYGIPSGNINQIIKDQSGNYWFLHESAGLYCYNSQKNTSRKYKQYNQASITAIALSNNNSLQLIYSDGYLEQINCSTSLPISASFLRLPNQRTGMNYQLFIDNQGECWVYAKNIPLGVYYIKEKTHQIIHFNKNSHTASLNTDMVSNITQDDNGYIWIATDHGGINLLNKNTLKLFYLLHDDRAPNSIAQNSTISLYRDNQHIIWLGTYKQGVSYYHPHIFMFSTINHRSNLPFDDVNRFVEDHGGNLWIGTNGGGLIYFDRKNNQFKQYVNVSTNSQSLSSNIIVSLLIDKEHHVWIGTYQGGLNIFNGKTFKHYPLGAENTGKLDDNSIWEIYQDSKDRIWIGTLSKGLFYYLPEQDQFVHVENQELPNYISAIHEDHLGNLWIGSTEGIVVLDKMQRIIKKFEANSAPASLSNNYISDILEDRQRRIWIATQDGLNLLSNEGKGFIKFGTADGLSDDVTLNLLEDQNGKIWVSTLKGITCISNVNERKHQAIIKNYSAHDGLQGVSFNENAALKTNRGELIFGGPSGFNIIKPEKTPTVKQQLNPIITTITLFNRTIEVGRAYQDKVILPHAPPNTQNISLKHNQNVFSITFSPLDYLTKERTQFIYKLVGFHDDWLPDAGNHKIVFTNLDPGTYHFLIRASQEDGTWSKPYTLLHITIAPPFWRTPIAYALYVCLILLTLLLIRRILKQRQRSRYLLQQEREEARQAVELEHAKTRFFTNISHDFRAPLSLILAPIDSLLDEKLTAEQHDHLVTMQRNAKRLLNLVNQLLDLKKADGKLLKLTLSHGDIIAHIKEHVDSFSDLAIKNKIYFSFSSNCKSLYTDFDQEKLERILFNLLSNAFKFTPQSGTIKVDVRIHQNKPIRELIITITDTGIGIPATQQSKIFDRYFQTPNSHTLFNQGNGIGLSITQEYVQLLGGHITLNSQEGEGSTFTIHLPLNTEKMINEVDKTAIKSADTTILTHDEKQTPHLKNAPLVLLVDDDEELVFYLKENLKHNFHIEYTHNAANAWHKILALHPDLILSDIQMPGGSGIDLCKKVKGDSRTHHIPIILLTAYTDTAIQLTAINNGASDYVTKPFHYQLLISKINSQLKQKTLFEKTYKKQLEVVPTPHSIESEDEKFVRKAAQIVENNLTNPSFSVEELARALHISRVGLYKRLLALNGHTPSEFIRNIRLKRAALLLAKSNQSIAEIAYQVGFNNPKQFSKYFKAMYHVLPSIYKQGNEDNE